MIRSATCCFFFYKIWQSSTYRTKGNFLRIASIFSSGCSTGYPMKNKEIMRGNLTFRTQCSPHHTRSHSFYVLLSINRFIPSSWVCKIHKMQKHIFLPWRGFVHYICIFTINVLKKLWIYFTTKLFFLHLILLPPWNEARLKVETEKSQWKKKERENKIVIWENELEFEGGAGQICF